MPIDRYLIVRAGALYVTSLATLAVWIWRRPPNRAWSAGLIASLCSLPALLALNVTAARAGWWNFDASGGLLLGVPVDLLLAWAWIWSALPILAFPTASVATVLLIAFSADLALMPAAAPVVRLGRTWLWGEIAALIAVLVPAQLLARWTWRDERLAARAALQMIGFAGMIAYVIPAMVIQSSGGRWTTPLTLQSWEVSLIVQALAVPLMIGVTAVQECTAGD